MQMSAPCQLRTGTCSTSGRHPDAYSSYNIYVVAESPMCLVRRVSQKDRRSGMSCTRQDISTAWPRRIQCCSSLQPPQAPYERDRKKLAVFVSGGGSNFKAIHQATLDGRINADVVVVVSNAPGCGGWQYAEQHGIATLVYPSSNKLDSLGLSAEQLAAAVADEHAVDIVLLAGYIKLVPPELVRRYKRAMLNIHPGLLPAFGGKGFFGLRVHQAVVSSGARFTGPSIHFVDEEYDTGPILAQRVIAVHPFDTPQTLAARVLQEEHALYPMAVAAVVDGRVTWRADGVPVLWTAR